MSASKRKEVTFESGLARLESLIEQLEDGGLDLDKSLSVFEEGIKLSRELNQLLDGAEKRLEILIKDEDGQPLAREFPDLENDKED
jgi:exodeoxyribonuclease VII small subunit